MSTGEVTLRYLEDVGLKGKKLYPPGDWIDRIRHYTKRTHDIDIKPTLQMEQS